MKKGFTLIELLAVIVVLAIIAIIATPIVLSSINTANKGAFKSSAYGIVDSANFAFAKDVLNNETLTEVTYTYTAGVESRNPAGEPLDYKNTKPNNGVLKINEEGEIAIAIHDGKYCASKGYGDKEILIFESILADCEMPVEPYVDGSGATPPLLTEGMTPIKWNGTEWVSTTVSDSEWYDYDNKEWANAKTADDSFWVWIPRYAYSITSGYHTDTKGNIEIEFLTGITNVTKDNSTVDKTPTYNVAKTIQTNYVQHPAFTFGEEEIEGFWVAKFEPSGTESDISVLPNVTSLRNMTIGDQFDAAINMKTNSKYGWTSSNVDTHMAKNSEWGAVAYLTQSIYGANDKIMLNNSDDYITGCAATDSYSNFTYYCENEYDTINGQKASSTYNIYGVYDMSGGSFELPAAYLNNGNSILTTNAQSLLNADLKYKDVYEVGTTDHQVDNYEQTVNKFGDAVYETSISFNSWYDGSAQMPSTSDPILIRGGYYESLFYGTMFYLSYFDGSAIPLMTFRPIVISQ